MENDRKALSQWFADKSNWFVVFVRTREEQKIAQRLQSKLDTKIYKVFVPTKDYAHKNNKETTIIRKPLFSGYLFLATMVEAGECLLTVEPLFYRDPDIYKLLSNDGHSRNIQLTKRDKALMVSILDADFNLSAFKAVIEGDWVQVDDSPLAGFDAKVVKVNKRRQTAVINMLFAGNRMDCEVALELI